MTDFSGLDLIEPLQRALSAEGYAAPTPIQAQSIPHLLAGRDLLGVAQTGTGKTAAFVLPLLQNLAETSKGYPKPGRPRALILAPTRELAVQIGDSVRVYGKFMKLTSTTIFGGAPMGKQIRALAAGVDVVIATPGRLMDHLRQKKLTLDAVETFILDEADRMLDMGFVPDVRKIAALIGEDRQTVQFSATMPPAVAKLANTLLNDPVRVEVAAQSTTAERIDQKVLFVPKPKKRELLNVLLEDDSIYRVLVFTRTKHGADRVARSLEQNRVRTGVIHGNKSQNQRQRALNGFKKGHLRVLVATDIAARGIDVDGVTHVINFDLPQDPETYVHRIGRTARGGAEGQALSFCDHEERAYLTGIERVTRRTVEIHLDHPFHAEDIANSNGTGGGKGTKGGRGRGSGRGPARGSGPGKRKPSAFRSRRADLRDAEARDDTFNATGKPKHAKKSHRKGGSKAAVAADGVGQGSGKPGGKPAKAKPFKNKKKPFKGKKGPGGKPQGQGRRGGPSGGKARAA